MRYYHGMKTTPAAALIVPLLASFLIATTLATAQIDAHAAAPEWLTRLFPDTGKPDRLDHRLRRISAGELNVNGRTGASVIVELAYPGLDGRDETAQARIFLPPIVKEAPAIRVPLIHVAGDEIDEKGAIGLMAKGYAVMHSACATAEPARPRCQC